MSLGVQAFGFSLDRRTESHGRVGTHAPLDPVTAGDPGVHRRAPADRGGGRGGEARFPGSFGADRRRLHESIAADKQFDVLLVNAVMDGLDLFAKEAPYLNPVMELLSSLSTQGV